jgi:hypothetical protein
MAMILNWIGWVLAQLPFGFMGEAQRGSLIREMPLQSQLLRLDLPSVVFRLSVDLASRESLTAFH